MPRSLQKSALALVMVLGGELFGEFFHMETYFNTKKSFWANSYWFYRIEIWNFLIQVIL